MTTSPPAETRALAPRERAPAGTPLYVHVPFCAAKCRYCDFFSVPAEGQDRGANLDALLREIDRFAPSHPTTVFVGGGTPSLLSTDELTRLFDGIERACGFRGFASEVTVECNPESLDREKARRLLDLGVTRFSIGFQSLSNDVLELFGRVHSVDDSFRAYEAVRAAGATNVNVDLIYAIPGQTAEQWEPDLERVLALEPDHLSAYNLTFEEDTLFRRWLEEGRISKSPEEVELALFDATRRQTAAAGLYAYEISNFARDGRRCAHNENYWRNGTYLGVGPSAVSKVGTARAGNPKSISAYNRAIRETGEAWQWRDEPAARARLAETWWLGLRLAEGLSPAEARARAAFDERDDPLEPLAHDLAAQGVLARRGERFVLSERGLPLADWVARRFLER